MKSLVQKMRAWFVEGFFDWDDKDEWFFIQGDLDRINNTDISSVRDIVIRWGVNGQDEVFEREKRYSMTKRQNGAAVNQTVMPTGDKLQANLIRPDSYVATDPSIDFNGKLFAFSGFWYKRPIEDEPLALMISNYGTTFCKGISRT